MKKNKCFTETELWDSYNTLMLSSDTSRVRKLIVRYELFKKAIKVPGDIIECGVFKGSGWMYWLKLLDLYARGEQRKVIGFDTFGAFSDSLLEYEKQSAEMFVKEADFEGVNPELILKQASDYGFKNGELISGNVEDTLPEYRKNNPGFRISLINLDFDTYSGTKVALENLYDYVSPGGIIILDEYGKRGWGESDAVDDFIKGTDIKLHAIKGSFQPTAYIQK